MGHNSNTRAIQNTYSTPPSSRSVAGDTETGPKLLEDGSRQSLSHHISKLLRRRHVENPNTAKGNLLAHEVNIELNMLRPSMVHRVGGEVDRADVIAVDKSGLVNITKQLLEQLTSPRALGHGVSHDPILCLGTGAGDRGLPLR